MAEYVDKNAYEVSIWGIKIGGGIVYDSANTIINLSKLAGKGVMKVPDIVHMTWKDYRNHIDFRRLQHEAKLRILTKSTQDDDYKLAYMPEQTFKHHFQKTQVLVRAIQEGAKIESDTFDSIDDTNPNFLDNFWDTAKKYSSEEMQILWAKMLAKEIKKPKTFDVAAIEKLRIMSDRHVESFNNLIQSSGVNLMPGNLRIFTFDINTNEPVDWIKYFNLNYMDLMELEKLGLLHTSLLAPVKVFFIADYYCISKETLKIDCIEISEIGNKIMQLVEENHDKINQEYSKKIQSYCDTHNIDCEKAVVADKNRDPNDKF